MSVKPPSGTERSRSGNADATFDVQIRERFDRQQVANEYAQRKNHRNTWKNRRELACIQTALNHIPAGAVVLDLPTGSGRLLPMLHAMGYRVIAADYSPHMLKEAQAYFAAQVGTEGDYPRFETQDVMQISLPDKSVDVVISNRLFHHYPTSELRQRALKELARVARDRLIISYFSNYAVSALRFHIRNRSKNPETLDRMPIWPSAIYADARAAGLEVEHVYAVRPGLSPQTYLLLKHI